MMYEKRVKRRCVRRDMNNWWMNERASEWVYRVWCLAGHIVSRNARIKPGFHSNASACQLASSQSWLPNFTQQTQAPANRNAPSKQWQPWLAACQRKRLHLNGNRALCCIRYASVVVIAYWFIGHKTHVNDEECTLDHRPTCDCALHECYFYILRPAFYCLSSGVINGASRYAI